LCTDVTMAIFCLLLLVALGSDVCAAEKCTLSVGGYFAIVDSFLWLGASALVYQMRAVALTDELANEPAETSNAHAPARDVKMIENGDGADDKETRITTKSPGGRNKRPDKVKKLKATEEP
jgi:hypothetical protein